MRRKKPKPTLLPRSGIPLVPEARVSGCGPIPEEWGRAGSHGRGSARSRGRVSGLVQEADWVGFQRWLRLVPELSHVCCSVWFHLVPNCSV